MVTAADVVGTAALGESVSKISRAGKCTSAVQMCDESGAAMNVIKGTTTIHVHLVDKDAIPEPEDAGVQSIPITGMWKIEGKPVVIRVVVDGETGKLLGQVDDKWLGI